jgi:hypothetical protein
MTLNFQKAEKAALLIWTVKTILLGRGLTRPLHDVRVSHKCQYNITSPHGPVRRTWSR